MRRLLLTLAVLVMFPIASWAQAPGVSIGNLPAYVGPVAPTDQIPIVQSYSGPGTGVTRRVPQSAFGPAVTFNNTPVAGDCLEIVSYTSYSAVLHDTGAPCGSSGPSGPGVGLLFSASVGGLFASNVGIRAQ